MNSVRFATIILYLYNTTEIEKFSSQNIFRGLMYPWKFNTKKLITNKLLLAHHIMQVNKVKDGQESGEESREVGEGGL